MLEDKVLDLLVLFLKGKLDPDLFALGLEKLGVYLWMTNMGGTGKSKTKDRLALIPQWAPGIISHNLELIFITDSESLIYAKINPQEKEVEVSRIEIKWDVDSNDIQE